MSETKSHKVDRCNAGTGRQISLRTFLALFTSTVVACWLFSVIITLESEGNHVTAPMLLVCCGSWAVFTLVLCRSFARKATSRLLIAAGSILLVYGIYAATLQTRIALLTANPPPRPMFHNRFGKDKRSRLPVWHQEFVMYDTLGNLVYVDYEDNSMFFIVRGAADGTFQTAIGELNEAQIPINGLWFTVPRATNALVVVRSDGKFQRFVLPANVVRNFHEKRRGLIAKTDYVTDVEMFLDDSDVQRLRAFAVNSPAL